MILRFVSTALQIVALMTPMAVGLKTGPGPAAAQQQLPKSIGRAAAQRATSDGIPQTPPIPNIHLIADRDSALVGETVTFTLDPIGPVNSRYVFTIVFGDGSMAELSGDSSTIEHAYSDPGTVPISFSYKLRSPAANFAPITAAGSPPTLKINSVTLTSSPQNPVVGQTVTFETPFPNTRPDIRYRFIFGDEPDATLTLVNEPRSTHTYTESGTFDARLEVGHSKGGDFSVFAKANTQVEVTPAAVVTPAVVVPPVDVPVITSSPSNPGEGETVAFLITYPPGGSDLVFRVEFGDGSPLTEWATSPTAFHAYRPAGTYVVHGEVGRSVNGVVVPLAKSADLFVVILAPRSPVWLWILLVAAGATAVTVRQYRKNIVAPRPVFEAHPDRTNSTPDIDGLTIDIQVRLIRNVLNGGFDLQTNGKNLIKSRRTLHG
ncbi:MAG TPA: PKD domain-containing protein [Terriglobia bacterium]|nr:PKD domain-containing protein [Terriglobia bacterium]